ncbi:MAG TPA: hypothetical protein VFK79_10805 [Xanthobacteraceae bacterium]|nr:hypothetical protein [Xanthobacteraceae bacterium]
MFKFIVINSIAAVIIVALSLALVIVLASMAPEAKAEILPASLLSDVVATAPACLLQGWPHYEPHCYFDLRTGNAESRIVRVIAVR